MFILPLTGTWGAITAVEAVHIVSVEPEREPEHAALPDIEVVPVRGALHLVADTVTSSSRPLAWVKVALGIGALLRVAAVLYMRYVRDWRDVEVTRAIVPSERVKLKKQI